MCAGSDGGKVAPAVVGAGVVVVVGKCVVGVVAVGDVVGASDVVVVSVVVSGSGVIVDWTGVFVVDEPVIAEESGIVEKEDDSECELVSVTSIEDSVDSVELLEVDDTRFV
eukprot:353374_1